MINISKEEIRDKVFFINEEDSNQPIAVIKVADLLEKSQPKGEWKFIQGATTQGSLKCPFCDYRDYHKTNSNFCPNCGAKMKGKNSSGEAYD